MKRTRIALMTVGALAASLLVLSQVRADAVFGTLSRSSNFDVSKSSGCKTATNGSHTVKFDSNLNILGGNLHIAPSVGCTTVNANHNSQLGTQCFDGFVYQMQSVNGTPLLPANIYQDCSRHGGGAYSIYIESVF